MRTSPPCWSTALLLVIVIPLTYIRYDAIAVLLNIVAVFGWVLAELYERELIKSKNSE